MTDLIQTLNSLGDTWAVHLFHATWQSTLVAVILLAIVALGRRLPSPLRYGLLLIALLKFAVPPMLSLPTGLFAWAPPPQTVIVYTPAVSIPDARPPFQSTTFTPPSTGIGKRILQRHAVIQSETTATGSVPVESSPPLTWKAQLMVVHILGSLCCLFILGFQVFRFRSSLRGAREVREGDIYTIHQNLCQQLKLRRIPRLLITDEETSPAAFGLFRRTILLSESTARKQSTDSIRMILAHELAHLKRWDLWINWLQLLLFTLWWFNPVYWYLSRKIRQTREDCCDDTLLSLEIGTGETYCDTLISAAEDLNHRTPIGATLGFAEKLHPLGRRMKRIMDPNLKRYRRLSYLGLALVAVMGLVLLPGLRAGVADSEKTWAEEASIEDLVQKIKEDEAWLWDVDSILIKASILQTSTEEAIKAQREYFEEFNRVSNRRVTISSDTEKEIDLIQGWDKSRYIHKTVEDDGRLSENLFAEGKSISRHGNMEENQIYETFGNSTDHLARDSFSYLSFGRLTDANTWWGKDKKRSMQFPVPPIESFTDGGVIERSGKEYRVIRSLRPSHREYWIETETGKLGYAVTYNTLSPSRADFAKDGRSRTGFLKHLARLLLSEEKFPGTYDSFMMWLEGANEDETEQFASILSQVFPDEVPTKNPEDALLRNYENVMRDLLDLLSSEDVLKDPVERIHESMMAELRKDPFLIETSIPFVEFRNEAWREVSTGHSFPYTQGIRTWVSGLENANLVASDRKITVTQLSVNEPLPDDLFQIDSEEVKDPKSSELASNLLKEMRDEGKESQAVDRMIEGEVVNRDGEVVIGAKVLLYYDDNRLGMNDRLVEEVATDSEGRFQFTTPIRFQSVVHHSYADDFYRVFATHPDYALAWESVKRSDPKAPIRLVLTEPRTEEVYVHDANGNPLEGAEVWVAGGGDRESSDPLFREYFSIKKDIGLSVVKTDSAGIAIVPNLPKVRCSFYAKLPDYAKHGGCAGTELELTPGASVTGQVVDQDGVGVQGASVQFMADWMHMAFGAQTDEHGQFKLEDLPAQGWDMSPWGAEGDATGIYKVTLQHDEMVAKATKVTLEPGQALSDFTIDAMPGVLVKCQVVDSFTGNPLSGARLWGENEIGRINGYTDNEGILNVRVLPGETKLFFQSPPDGVYIDTSRSSQTHRLDFEAKGEVMEMKMEAPPIAGVLVSVPGRITDSPDFLGENTTVYASAGSFETSTGSPGLAVGVNEDGSFELSGVPAGRELCLFAITKDLKFAGTGIFQIPAKPNEISEIEVELHPTNHASTIVRDDQGNPVKDTSLVFRPIVGGNTIWRSDQRAKTDSEGQMETDGIVPGLEYQIRDAQWEKVGAIEPGLFHSAMVLLEEG